MGTIKFTKTAEVVETEVEVSDGRGNVIAIPSKGVADYKEYKQVMARFIKAQNNPSLAAGIEIDVVACCLRYRFSIPSSMSDDEILQLENGQPMSAVFVKKLFEFFTQELGIEGLVKQQQPISQMEDAAPYLEKSEITIAPPLASLTPNEEELLFARLDENHNQNSKRSAKFKKANGITC